MGNDRDDSFKFHDSAADRRLAEAVSLWSYLPQLLRYPLRGYALGVVVVLGLLFAMALYAGLFGIAMLAILVGWLGFYLLEVVGDTASGHALPPPLGTEVFSQFEFGRIGLLLGYVIFLELVPLYLAVFHHSEGARRLAVVMLVILPAFIALLAMEDHAWEALNPFKLVLFIFQTGFAYLVICAVLVASLVVAVVIGRHLVSALAYMLLLYCLILVCHLLGFVAYHRQEQLGLTVAVAKPTEASRRFEVQQAALQGLLETIGQLAAANNAHAAVKLILQPAAGVTEPSVFYQQLFEALRARKHTALALVAGSRLMEVLARGKHHERALDIYEQCLDLASRFEPPDINLCVPLAETALQTRRFPLFEKIVAQVTARHPETEVAISLTFLRARYLAEFDKDDTAARILLEPLLANATHPWHTQITALYNALSGGSQRRHSALQ